MQVLLKLLKGYIIKKNILPIYFLDEEGQHLNFKTSLRCAFLPTNIFVPHPSEIVTNLPSILLLLSQDTDFVAISF